MSESSKTDPVVEKLNRTNDVHFKYVFGSPEHKDILIGFVNAVLSPDEGEDKICDLELEDRELPPDHYDGKEIRLDLRAKTSEGMVLNIEVQAQSQKCLDRRIMYYWARLYSKQIQRGEDYYKLRPTYVIEVMNFNFIPESLLYINDAHPIVSATGKPFTKDMSLFFIELPKWNALKRKANNSLERWIAFFANKNSAEVEEYAMLDPNIHAALEAEKRFIANDDQMRDYWQREKAIMERVSELAAAKDEGKVEGRAEEKENVARNMLSDNVPMQQIQKYTGLSVSEIEALQK